MFRTLFRYGGPIMNSIPMTKRELLQLKKAIHKRQIIRRRIALVIFSIFLIITFTLSLNGLSALATEEVTETSYKYFTPYVIQKDDTLWSIAEQYIDYDYYNSIQDYISEVRSINHIYDDMIISGKTIVIPYYSNMYF